MGTQALVTFSPEQREMVDVIKTTVYGGGNLSDAELKVYLASCEQVGVHPLAKGVHVWKDQKGRVGLAVSVHTLTALAERDHRAAMVDYEWEFDGDGKDRKILACTCIGEVWDDLTKSWRARRATVRREDVSHLFAKDNWRDQPFTMWESRARAKWCRTHRADVCGPLYTEDEVEDVRPPRPLAIAPATDADAAALEAEVVTVAQAVTPAAEPPKAEPEPRAAPLARDTPQGRRKVRWAGLCAALAIPTTEARGLAPVVEEVCAEEGIPKDSADWTDADASRVASCVAARRAAQAEPVADGGLPLADDTDGGAR